MLAKSRPNASGSITTGALGFGCLRGLAWLVRSGDAGLGLCACCFGGASTGSEAGSWIWECHSGVICLDTCCFCAESRFALGLKTTTSSSLSSGSFTAVTSGRGASVDKCSLVGPLIDADRAEETETLGVCLAKPPRMPFSMGGVQLGDSGLSEMI